MKNHVVEKRLNVYKVFIGTLNAYIITIFLFLAFSVILYFSAISEDIIPKAVIAIGALSIVFSSFNAARDLDYGGWLHGGFIGLLYVGFLMTLRFFITKEVGFDLGMLVDLGLGFLIGAIAGAIGVNL